MEADLLENGKKMQSYKKAYDVSKSRLGSISSMGEYKDKEIENLTEQKKVFIQEISDLKEESESS